MRASVMSLDVTKRPCGFGDVCGAVDCAIAICTHTRTVSRHEEEGDRGGTVALD